MKVLVACEFSGVVREAFKKRGCDAWSCDIEPTEIPGQHYQGDVRHILSEPWDLLIAHPPCTYLANSGVWALHRDEERWALMEEAAEFFRLFLYATHIPRRCVENPIMHKYARAIIGRSYDQTIQPWQFGEDASKRTCLWLAGLPKLESTDVIIKDRYANQTPSGQNKLGPSKDRAALRSKTYLGIAEAMAEQWHSIPNKQ